tara:strand:- start:1408 stop:2127 length:720 start_codon:yes stop_codon:yes gene_type:complete
MELVILAAGKGSRIFKSINRNKCLIKIYNQTLIEKIINDANSLKIFKKINIVTGYRKNKIMKKLKNYKINFIFNKDYNKKEMLHSLKVGIKNCKKDTLVTYSDIIFSKNIFEDINKMNKKKYILPVLKNWKKVWKIRKKKIVDDCESLNFDRNFYLTDIGKKIVNENIPKGQFMGIFFIPKNKIKKTINYIDQNKNNKKMHTTNFIDYLVSKKQKIKCIVKNYNWYEFDDIEDLKNFKK